MYVTLKRAAISDDLVQQGLDASMATGNQQSYIRIGECFLLRQPISYSEAACSFVNLESFLATSGNSVLISRNFTARCNCWNPWLDPRLCWDFFLNLFGEARPRQDTDMTWAFGNTLGISGYPGILHCNARCLEIARRWSQCDVIALATTVLSSSASSTRVQEEHERQDFAAMYAGAAVRVIWLQDGGCLVVQYGAVQEA
ncbi:hypothetical protein HYALB_00007739 [Hymenoscyphus albidus]|uniref:Uncharacterized protein n=1 Tax=Hymenoscyphus albidus TaxID=595503 RepID=A0A9N9LCQ4_9HELO|nr:hypothetical protein HYALB_00007739 [Hymenoscyphus albidus]